MAAKAGAKTTAVQVHALSRADSEMMAKAEALAASKVLPAAYAAAPHNIFAAIQYGRELGLPPMTSLQNIAVINGKPTLGTDMFLGLAMRHEEWGGYEITESTEKKATVKVYRVYKKSGKVACFVGSFTIEEAMAAGLARPNSPWEKWRKRMLKHRATAFALRDAFPDVMAGLYQGEEMDPVKGGQEEEDVIRAQEALEFEDLGVTDEPAPELPKMKSAGKSGTAYRNGRKVSK